MNCWYLLDSIVTLARPWVHQDARYSMSGCLRQFVSPKKSHFVNGMHACCQHELPETSAVEPVLFVSLKNFVLASLAASTPTYIKSSGILVVTVAVNGRLIHYQNNKTVSTTEEISPRENESRIELLTPW
jgi:hypothetical protein